MSRPTLTVENPDLEVIDCHVHLQRSPEHAQEMWSYYLRKLPMYGDEATAPALGTVEETRQLMADTGVVRANALMFTWAGRYYRDGMYTLPDAGARREAAAAELKHRIVERVRDNNDWVAQVCSADEDLTFFCGIDPLVMDEQQLVQELERQHAAGALGAKLVPADSLVAGDDPRMWPVYDWCAAKDFPILTAASSVPDHPGRPSRSERALREFPDLRLVFSHIGYSTELGAGGDAEVLALCQKYDGVFVDLSLRLTDVPLGRASGPDLVEFLRRLGWDRVMYGSNYPFTEMTNADPPPIQRPQRTQIMSALEVLHTLPCSDEERHLLASGNFRRLVNLPATGDAPGVPTQ